MQPQQHLEGKVLLIHGRILQIRSYDTDPSTGNIAKPSYYLLHHGVLKEDSLTTKLRAVFNGSALTTSGKSLNDIMHTGPNLSPNIVDVLIWIRIHPLVFSSNFFFC